MFWVLLSCAPAIDGLPHRDPAPDLGGVFETPPPSVEPLDPWDVPRLRWVRGHPDETWARAKQGLWWSLTTLGAVPPEDGHGLHVVSESENEVIFDLDLGECGTPSNALEAIRIATEDVWASDELELWGSIDVGRWVMRVLYEPWVYYAATGTCRNLEDWEAQRQDPDPLVYGITLSQLVDDHRVVELNERPGTIGTLAFKAIEGHGSLDDGTFVEEEYEIVDVMPNGLSHYAVYDLDGQLLPGGTPEVSPAGQPGRCMWCHEGAYLQHGSSENPGTVGSIGYDAFIAEIVRDEGMMRARREETNSIVHYDEDVHTWGEWLTVMFLESSRSRLALEWEITPDQVDAILDDLAIPRTTNEEFPETGDVVEREVLDQNAQAIVDALSAIPGHRFEGIAPAYTPIATQPTGRELDLETQTLFQSDELEALLSDCDGD